MKRLMRFVAALAAAAFLSVGLVSCKTGDATSSASSGKVDYKCGCGKKVTVDVGSAAPS